MEVSLEREGNGVTLHFTYLNFLKVILMYTSLSDYQLPITISNHIL